MSEYADEINQSGKLGLPGDIFAGPASNANLSGFKLTWRTGLSPSKVYKPIEIPLEGNKNFSNVTPIGFYTSWQRFMGHKYTSRGVLDLQTGDFSKTGVNWSQIKNYGADIAINVFAVGAGISVWKRRDE
jgi:hypothetical protein